MLARAVSDRKLSDRILDLGRRAFGGRWSAVGMKLEARGRNSHLE